MDEKRKNMLIELMEAALVIEKEGNDFQQGFVLGVCSAFAGQIKKAVQV